ncbi:LytR/AlgR family response regulator transcription factor [Brevibacillus sp. SYSU BS000544]|uniref:LytR/AlgR family response regulator transcription factor n=1 Tax=Brevibacillus sp. SYSU BS000544 TaxID=3416443 RepID=UPI003CE4C368
MFKKELSVLVVDDWDIHRRIAVSLLEHFPFVSQVSTAKSADEMIRKVKENPDINCLVIDVNLGEYSLNGIQAYSILLDEGYNIPAILITGENVDAFDSYTVGVIDVISKRFLYDFKRIKRAFENLQQYYFFKEFKESGGIFIPAYDGHTIIHQFLAAEVLYIESKSPGCLIHTIKQNEPVPSGASLRSYEEFLDEHNSRFEKLSRFHLVNTSHIKEFNGQDEITLTDGHVVTISNCSKKLVMNMTKKKTTNLVASLVFGEGSN